MAADRAYTGEVLVRVYSGQRVTHGQAAGSFAVSVAGTKAFPFAIADKVLRGEPYKSLASFARVLPAIAARASRTACKPPAQEGRLSE